MAGLDVAALGARDRHAQGMANLAPAHLRIAHEQGQDRQPGGVGARPSLRPQGVAAQVEHRSGPGFPSACGALGVVELIQPAGAALEHEHVAVARLPGALHRGARRDRIRTGV